MGMQGRIQNNKFRIIGNPSVIWKIHIDKGNVHGSWQHLPVHAVPVTLTYPMISCILENAGSSSIC